MVGKLILRFKYPDGRLTATVAIDGDWQVKVFASEAAARSFAVEYELEVEEMKNVDNG